MLKSPSFTVHSSNRLELLSDKLADWVAESRAPLQSQTIIVQSNGMARWLSLAVARRNSIAANIEFPYPASFIWQLYREVLGDRLPAQSPYNSDRLTWTLLELLPGLVDKPGFGSVKRYFDGTDMRSRFDLAARIADIFDQYLVFRPDWIAGWESGSADAFMAGHWQAKLWRAVHGLLGNDHRAALQTELFAGLDKAAPLLPARIAVFGIPTLPPGVLETFRRISQHCEVDIFMLAPCSEYWGDIVEEGELSLLGDDYLEVGNSLLAATGKQGKEFFNLMLSGGADSQWEDCSASPLAAGSTLLTELQSDILQLEQHGRDGKPVAELDENDGSLRIHSCHSPLREMEVLHGQLLALFNSDASLEPADVCVLSPVLDDYAPYIDAVFGALPRDDKRYIPFTIADQQRRDSEQLVEAFQQALLLAGSRFTVNAVLELLAQPAVGRQFDLYDADVELVKQWLGDTGVAWGLSGRHRETQGVPPTEIGTWSAGLRRLWLGYAMGGDCTGEDATLFGEPLTEPYSNIEGQQVEVLGRLQRLIDLLEGWSRFVKPDRPLLEWLAWMNQGLDNLLAPESTDALILLRETLAGLADCGGSYRQPIPLSVVLDAWQARRQGVEGGSGFLAGAVTFASMVPMRSLPFKVLCLVGLNGSVYPRVIRPPEFDLMAMQPRAGDRSRRNDDRYLFLEALLSARQTLYLSYVGQSQRDDAEIPPSVLVAELLDTIDRGFTVNDQPASKALLTKHPLQAFSRQYFRADTTLISYRADLAKALSVSAGTVPEKPFWDGPLQAEPESYPLLIDAEDILAMALKPARYLLRSMVDMQLPQLRQELDSREMMHPDGLQQWQLLSGLLTSAADKQRLLASGELPAEPVGSLLYQQFELKVSAQQQFHRQLCGDCEPELLNLSVELEGAVISGAIGNIFDGSLIVSSPSKISHERKVWLWLQHCLLCAAGYTPNSYWLAREKYVHWPPLAQDQALAALQPWVEAWHALHEGRVLLDANVGYFESKQSGTTPPEQRLADAANDPWVRQLYGRFPPYDSAAADWVSRLYGPYVEHYAKDIAYGQ